MIFEIRFTDGEKSRVITSPGKSGGVSVSVLDTPERVSLDILPEHEITLHDVTVTLPFEFRSDDSLFLNGYQSWTDSRERGTRYAMHGLRRVPRFIEKKYIFRPYGDYDFARYSGRRGELHGFTYAYVRREERFLLFASLAEKSGFCEIRFDVKRGTVTFSKDCARLVIGEKFSAIDMLLLDGAEDGVFDAYFAALGTEKPTAKPIRGYTSWYNHYQNISEKIILDNLTAAKNSPVAFDVFQIDDGWQTRVGDWQSVDSAKFPHGLSPVAEKIRATGLMPGLWLAPFAAEYQSDVAKAHPDWLLRQSDGTIVRGGGNWGGFCVLDFYNEDVRRYIRACFDTVVREWGFGLVKLDFLYAACLAPDKRRTRGTVMHEVMDFLKCCAGDAKILACGVPLAAAFGKADYCRIGCDVGLDYDDKPPMRLLHRERVSTKNSMGNTVFRRQLSGRAFLCDPDVFLLRDDNIRLSREEKYKLAVVNSLFGDVLFTSDDVSSYDSEKMKILKKITSPRPESIKVEALPRRVVITAGHETITLKM